MPDLDCCDQGVSGKSPIIHSSLLNASPSCSDYNPLNFHPVEPRLLQADGLRRRGSSASESPTTCLEASQLKWVYIGFIWGCWLVLPKKRVPKLEQGRRDASHDPGMGNCRWKV